MEKNGNIRKKTGMWLVGAGLLAMGAAFVLPSSQGSASPATVQDVVPQSDLASAAGLPDRSIGNADAPVTIVEYASATCSHCARFAVDEMPEVRREILDKGLARFVFREFPLDPRALAASMIARCVPEDAYFPVVEDFFSRQAEWAPAKNALPTMLEIAAKHGLDRPGFEKCLSDGPLQDGIRKTKEQASKLGVDVTPSFFVAGKLHKGGMSAQDLLKLVREATPAK